VLAVVAPLSQEAYPCTRLFSFLFNNMMSLAKRTNPVASWLVGTTKTPSCSFPSLADLWQGGGRRGFGCSNQPRSYPLLARDPQGIGKGKESHSIKYDVYQNKKFKLII
jgi:hypothetical protein